LSKWIEYVDEVKALLLKADPPIALDGEITGQVLDDLMKIMKCYTERIGPEEEVDKTHRDMVRDRVVDGGSLTGELTLIEDGSYYHYVVSK